MTALLSPANRLRFSPRLCAIAALALITACGTPQERCINSATRDLRIVNRLIGETETNLKRGYALEEVVRTHTRWVVCKRGIAATATTPAQAPVMCLRDRKYTVTRPKAINLADERQTLAELQKKRRTLTRDASKLIQQCKVIHPE